MLRIICEKIGDEPSMTAIFFQFQSDDKISKAYIFGEVAKAPG